jgi:hypothetical protein
VALSARQDQTADVEHSPVVAVEQSDAAGAARKRPEIGGEKMWRKWLTRIFGERKVKPEEVLRCFLEFEATQPRDDEIRRITHGVQDASAEDLLRMGRELDQHYKDEHDEEIPALLWTCDELSTAVEESPLRRFRIPQFRLVYLRP